MSNVGVSQCKFCGINVGKGINAGVETMRNRVKNVDSFSRENLQNKVVKKVLGGSSMSGGNDGYIRDEHLAQQIAKWKELMDTLS